MIIKIIKSIIIIIIIIINLSCNINEKQSERSSGLQFFLKVEVPNE
jgi:hypothetical protein